MTNVNEMTGEHFPPGKYRVAIDKMEALMDFLGEDILVNEFGVMFLHKGTGLQVRRSFFPWHKVQRIWQIGG